MRTKTLNPGVKWCNEAYENADVIIYDNSFFKKEYVTDSEVYFLFFNVLATSIIFRRIKITKNAGTISYVNQEINFK